MHEPGLPRPAVLDALDARLLNRLQRDLPLCPRPFEQLGAELGCPEWALIERLSRMLADGTLTRFGPLFQIERAGGRFVLAAMAVPEPRFAAVAAQLAALPEVAHNYRREHALNMWFVVGAETPAAADAACVHIETLTGLRVLAFPKEREYGVGLFLPVAAPGEPLPEAVSALDVAAVPTQADDAPLSELERRLLRASQQGLPLLPRPFEALGAMLGLGEDEVLQAFAAMRARGLVRRIAAVPDHYRLGYVANGMSVWDVDERQIDRLAALIAAQPGVSHCYRRPRRLPDWPYNLFAMLHGHRREAVQAQAARLRALLGPACRAHDILYSSAILKKTGLRLREQAPC